MAAAANETLPVRSKNLSERNGPAWKTYTRAFRLKIVLMGVRNDDVIVNFLLSGVDAQ